MKNDHWTASKEEEEEEKENTSKRTSKEKVRKKVNKQQNEQVEEEKKTKAKDGKRTTEKDEAPKSCKMYSDSDREKLGSRKKNCQ